MLTGMTDVTSLLQSARVPGAVASWGDAGGAISTAVSGVTSQGGPRVTESTRYDLASLTKVVATLPAVLRLASDGELDLDGPLRAYFSNAGSGQEPSLGDVTARQLLSHSGGLPAFSRVHTITDRRQIALAGTLQMTLDNQPGGQAVYSDVGFMLLGALVERISGQRLDRFVTEQVFGPLSMTETHFNPLDSDPQPAEYAATENCGWRNRLLVGEVHDENCVAWEGVAGHAGLFGPAHDLAAYASAWLNLDERLGKPELLRDAITEHARTQGGEIRGLGWVLGPANLSGGKPGYGHTGFTGTSLWINPETQRFGVLLTNRVHPDRNTVTGIHELRADFHRLVLLRRESAPSRARLGL